MPVTTNFPEATVPIGLSHHDPLLDDVNARHARLSNDRERLFSHDISIDVLNVPGDEELTTYKESAVFEQECLRQQPDGSRYYILKPAKPHVISRSPLHVSEDITRKMMDAHEVMPSFLDHLHAYGRRGKREEDASFGGGRYKLRFADDKIKEHEFCYTVKFGVNNGRMDANNPRAYSIRQTSVYQKFRYDAQESVWVVVQPSESVQSRMLKVAPKLTAKNPLSMHLLFFSAASEGWRDYYNHLERIFYDTTKAAVNFSVQRSNEKYNAQRPGWEGSRGDPVEKFEIDFDDVQGLQRLEELLRSVKTALDINEDSIRSLKALNDKLRDLSGLSLSAWGEIDTEAEQQLAIIAGHKRNFDSLLKNVHGRSQLLYNILDFKNALTVSYTSQRAVDIRNLQVNEQAMTTMLKEMSMRDAMGVRILTLLATLYVPASFVATFLDAGIITFDASRSDRKSVDFKRLLFSRETAIVYVVFTVLLMVLTYGCWWVWFKREDREVTQQLSVSRANSMEPEKGLSRMQTGHSSLSNPVPLLRSPRPPFSSPPTSPVSMSTPMSPMSV